MGLTDATCFADCALCRTVVVRENVLIARDTYRIRFDCPEIARQIVPGQFLMMRLTGCNYDSSAPLEHTNRNEETT